MSSNLYSATVSVSVTIAEDDFKKNGLGAIDLYPFLCMYIKQDDGHNYLLTYHHTLDDFPAPSAIKASDIAKADAMEYLMTYTDPLIFRTQKHFNIGVDIKGVRERDYGER